LRLTVFGTVYATDILLLRWRRAHMDEDEPNEAAKISIVAFSRESKAHLKRPTACR
jgi:hypothetical protein